MSAHTPGSWRMETSFDDEFAAGSFEIVAGEGRYRVVLATRMPWSGRRAESWANGNLMAAAPDLLAALKLAHAEHAKSVLFGSEALRAMEAAIAKAEGRS